MVLLASKTSTGQNILEIECAYGEMLYAFGLMLIEVGVSFDFILAISHFNHDTTAFLD
jgi:hypothetical protein